MGGGGEVGGDESSETHDTGARLPGFKSQLVSGTSHILVLCSVTCVWGGMLGASQGAGRMRIFVQKALTSADLYSLRLGTHR